MVGDGYYGRLVRKMPYYRTQPHRMNVAGLDSLLRVNWDPVPQYQGQPRETENGRDADRASRPLVIRGRGAPSGGGATGSA